MKIILAIVCINLIILSVQLHNLRSDRDWLMRDIDSIYKAVYFQQKCGQAF